MCARRQEAGLGRGGDTGEGGVGAHKLGVKVTQAEKKRKTKTRRSGALQHHREKERKILAASREAEIRKVELS